MPYAIKKSGNGYKVYNKETGKTYSRKPMPKEKALKQMKALYANMNEMFHIDKPSINEIANLIGENFEDGSTVRMGSPVHFATFDQLKGSINKSEIQGIDEVVSLIGKDSEDDCDVSTGCVVGNATETKENDSTSMSLRNLESICKNCESIRDNIHNLKPWMAHKLSIVYAYINDIEESISSEV